MFFNEFLWGNFKESQYGQEVIQFFSHYEDHILHNNRETYLKIKQRIDFNTRAGEEDEDEAYPQNYAEKVKGLYQEALNNSERN